MSVMEWSMFGQLLLIWTKPCKRPFPCPRQRTGRLLPWEPRRQGPSLSHGASCLETNCPGPHRHPRHTRTRTDTTHNTACFLVVCSKPDSLLDPMFIRLLLAHFSRGPHWPWALLLVCLVSPSAARILLSQVRENLPPWVSNHSQYLITFLILTLGLPLGRILLGQFSNTHSYPWRLLLVIIHPYPHTLLTGCTAPPVLAVLGVNLDLSLLLR